MSYRNYPITLLKLAALLKDKSLSAKEISEEMEVSRPTAYALISALEEHGYRFEKELFKEDRSVKGPKAVTYKLVKVGKIPVPAAVLAEYTAQAAAKK
jgi:orotate phosphoribosyltransferase-like protein